MVYRNADDIINASKGCIKRGINVNWNLKWTKLNTDDMNSLSELAESMGINSFINGEFNFYGRFFPKQAEKSLPTSDDLSKIKYEVIDKDTLKTAEQYVEDIKNGITFEFNTVSFDNIYVTDDLNVYPLGHMSRGYCLGNIHDSPDTLIENIKIGSNLPEAIIRKRNHDFSDLVLKYADIDSHSLHSPQSLFSMLYFEHINAF